MRTQEMRRTIAEKVREERRTHKAAKGIRIWSRQNQLDMSEADITRCVRFAKEYIEHVPAIPEAAEAAARQVGLIKEVTGFWEVAERYWFEPNDVFPTRSGYSVCHTGVKDRGGPRHSAPRTGSRRNS